MGQNIYVINCPHKPIRIYCTRPRHSGNSYTPPLHCCKKSPITTNAASTFILHRPSVPLHGHHPNHLRPSPFPIQARTQNPSLGFLGHSESSTPVVSLMVPFTSTSTVRRSAQTSHGVPSDSLLRYRVLRLCNWLRGCCFVPHLRLRGIAQSAAANRSSVNRPCKSSKAAHEREGLAMAVP